MSKQSKKLSDGLFTNHGSPECCTPHGVEHDTMNPIAVIDAVRELEVRCETLAEAEKHNLARNLKLEAENERLKDERDALLAEVETLRRVADSKGYTFNGYTARELAEKHDTAIRERDAARAELAQEEKDHRETEVWYNRAVTERNAAERDQATADYGKLKGEALAAYKTVATERDEARAECEAQTLRAEVHAANSQEWKEVADTWAKQHHELGMALDAAEAKLAAVREFANSDRCMNGHADDILAILDGAPKADEQVAVAKQVVEEWKGAMADLHDETEVVTREVVLISGEPHTYGTYVVGAELIKGSEDLPGLLARATVTFHVKKPRKG